MNYAGLHLKRRDVDWAKVNQEIRDSTMQNLGLRCVRLPMGRFLPRVGAEWETRCEGCGLRLIYCTTNQEPDRSVCFCKKCQEGPSP